MDTLTKLKLSVRDIIAVSGESQNNVFYAIRQGHLKTFVVGRRRFARPQAVRDWVDFLERESNAGRPVKYQSVAQVESKRRTKIGATADA